MTQWWRDAVIYQIYPRSFADGDGDGMGDLVGVTARMGYLAELGIGSPVVHLEHGVGRYLGLQTREVDGERAEFLCIEYAEAAKLFVPVTALDMISRYTGIDTDAVTLNRLGSDRWARARRKAQEEIRDVAAELLEIYARRESRPARPPPCPRRSSATASRTGNSAVRRHTRRQSRRAG